METAPRNCRFLSLVVVELVLRLGFMREIQGVYGAISISLAAWLGIPEMVPWTEGFRIGASDSTTTRAQVQKCSMCLYQSIRLFLTLKVTFVF